MIYKEKIILIFFRKFEKKDVLQLECGVEIDA